MAATEHVIKALAVVCELTGTELSKPALGVMAGDLSAYPEQRVLQALQRCRMELKGRLTLADVIARIDDGRPGAEEAWGMVPLAESATVVWTQEMSKAWAVASPLVERGDKVAARMAFVETYRKLVADARANREEAEWSISLGWDEKGREAPLREAVAKRRLPYEDVAGYLPPPYAEPLIKALPGSSDADKQTGARHISEIRAALAANRTPEVPKPQRQREPGDDDDKPQEVSSGQAA